MVAKFNSKPQQSYTAEFEVKEYGETSSLSLNLLLTTCTYFLSDWTNNNMRKTFSVLPSFEVKLLIESSFFYVDSEDLDVNIKATYVKVLVLWL